MLQIKDICKEYRTGDLVQKALDHVSLNLRDNEFVAILGPSGSGKTTLLNVIGGLDHYDSGDLIINGISTKKYKDRDWDSYRNHTIGFVFQSYNLIPHQTVLSNVELALTISGISGKERKERAVEALKKVGLGDQIHKKPNQMSGGQMQRVALARALVNDPDILLADEPTGALDTETSVQVMDLLKEVAKDRLVVMVTHNPELAHRYATRIVNLKDGVIRSDSDPYVIDEETEKPPVHQNMGKSSMSLLTSLSLSLNNLMTKKARTILVSFAGSIGIIGIALILSLSNGVNRYIRKTEEDTMAEYPLEIQRTSFSLSSMMENNGNEKKERSDKGARENDVVTGIFSKMSANDLKSLKSYLDSDQTTIKKYANSVEYRYDVTPQIYRMDQGKVRQVNPNHLLSSSGIAPTSSVYSSAFSMDVFSGLPSDPDLYHKDYDVKAGRWPRKYNEAVVVLGNDGTVSDMTLYTLGLKDYDQLQDLVDSFTEKNATGKETVKTDDGRVYPYGDFIGITFQMVPSSSMYTYDTDMKVWVDHSEDADYLKNLVETQSEELKIVGVVEPKEGEDITMLTQGIDYDASLTKHIIAQNEKSGIVQAQKNDPQTNVLTGKKFGENQSDGLDLNDLFTVNPDALQSAFRFDTSRLKLDTSSLNRSLTNVDFSEYMNPSMFSSISLKEADLNSLMQSALKTPDSKVMQEDVQKLMNGYVQYMQSDEQKDALQKLEEQSEKASFSEYLKTDEAKAIMQDAMNAVLKEDLTEDKLQAAVNALIQNYQSSSAYDNADPFGGLQKWLTSDEGKNAISAQMNSLAGNINISEDQAKDIVTKLGDGYTAWLAKAEVDPQILTDSLSGYLNSAEGQKVINDMVSAFIDTDQLNASVKNLADAYGKQISSSLTSSMQKMMQDVSGTIVTGVQQSVMSMVSQLPQAMVIDTDAFQKAVTMKMDEKEMSAAITSMMTQKTDTYADNLKSFGYADEDSPSEIVIYPKNFNAKDSIKKILNAYNQKMKDSDQSDKVISYTDVVGAMMSTVTEIVNTISYVLIAFVAISLVVSSIMIGVITYISVLERQKEIGILRAIGASKHNISEVFNAETFITGLLAGVLGIGISLILLIPGNYIIHQVTGRTDLNAVMPAGGAGALILLSVLLTMLGGLIPSHKAAKSDPVKALRTE